MSLRSLKAAVEDARQRFRWAWDHRTRVNFVNAIAIGVGSSIIAIVQQGIPGAPFGSRAATVLGWFVGAGVLSWLLEWLARFFWNVWSAPTEMAEATIRDLRDRLERAEAELAVLRVPRQLPVRFEFSRCEHRAEDGGTLITLRGCRLANVSKTERLSLTLQLWIWRADRSGGATTVFEHEHDPAGRNTPPYLRTPIELNPESSMIGDIGFYTPRIAPDQFQGGNQGSTAVYGPVNLSTIRITDLITKRQRDLTIHVMDLMMPDLDCPPRPPFA